MYREIMKVLVTDPISQEGIEKIMEEIDVDVATDLTEKELIKRIKDYEALIVRSGTNVTREVINAGVRLRVIGRAGAGVDNIDVDAATEKGIIVLNAPGGNTTSAAEHTIAMILSLSRNIPQANASLKKGEWNRSKFIGTEIQDKILGIIGLGRVGAEVAKKAHALGMHIIACDPLISTDRADILGTSLVDMDVILERSDYITIHAPSTKDTYHMIGDEQFGMMKKGVRIINCARGDIIDEGALIKAIKSEKVAGAALDVFENEPPEGSPLLDLDEVIVTPHLGASTKEAQFNVSIAVAEGVLHALKGEPARNAVNMPSIKSEIIPYLTLAEKLGRLCIQLVDGSINQIDIIYSGEIAERETGALTIAVLKGMLDVLLKESVNFVNAPMLAKNRGIKVVESKIELSEDFTGLITVSAKTSRADKRVAGTLFGKKDARIVRIDSYRIDALPSGYMLIASHVDKPGIIGRVGTILGENNINIAGMQVGREFIGGNAVMVLNIDSAVSDRLLKQIKAIEGIQDIRHVKL